MQKGGGKAGDASALKARQRHVDDLVPFVEGARSCLEVAEESLAEARKASSDKVSIECAEEALSHVATAYEILQEGGATEQNLTNKHGDEGLLALHRLGVDGLRSRLREAEARARRLVEAERRCGGGSARQGRSRGEDQYERHASGRSSNAAAKRRKEKRRAQQRAGTAAA